MLILISRLIFMAAVWRLAEGKAPLPYIANDVCNNVTSEYYLKDLKMCCSKCKPGTRLVEKCTVNSDTICAPCPDGEFSETFNYFPKCFSCRRCKFEKGLVYATKCSADTNSVCGCNPGMFCLKTSRSFCDNCKKYTSCKPGEYIIEKGSPEADVKCEACIPGKFSNHTNAELCQPHTQCDGGSVLKPGSSTADTECDMTAPPAPTTKTTTTVVSLQISSKRPQPIEPRVLRSQKEEEQPMNTTTTPSLLPSSSTTPSTPANQTTSGIGSNPDTMTLIYCTVIVCVLVLLTLLVMITCKLRKRKEGFQQKIPITGVNQIEQGPSGSVIPDYQRLLPTDKCQKEPSMSSSDGQSQPDSSHSHNSGDWLERTSQEESLPELPSVSSPLVNLSITATFNCQLNPGTASCSIPLSPSALTPHVEAPVPLSQEEVCISCQQEEGKEVLQSVQESGPCGF